MKWTKNQIEEMHRNGFEREDDFYGMGPVYTKDAITLINDADEIENVLESFDAGCRVCVMHRPKSKAKYMVYECEGDGYWLYSSFGAMMKALPEIEREVYCIDD